jgi:16S rRNA (cytidine1402-2'-O)-methyltransferase
MVLMSDGGLPGFCDPGAELIYKCHTEKIRVHCRPFFNSVMLSLVLSGLPHKNFSFLGFPPAKKNERIQFFKDNQKKKETLILMDTPYRLNQICEEMELSFKDRMLFLAMDLDNDQEQTWLLPIAEIMKKLGTQKLKKEFVAIVGPAGFVGY